MICINNIFIKTVAIVFAAVFFSCKDNYQDIKRMHQVQIDPAGVAENINLKHTDSGLVKLHLISKKMLDYSNKQFAYTEFPEGIELYVFEGDKKTTITADKAFVYNATDLIDMRGNVKVKMHDGKRLVAEQLYYDQKNEWVFTNQPYKYEAEYGGYNIGKGGFDANIDFTIFSSLDNDGQQFIDN